MLLTTAQVRFSDPKSVNYPWDRLPRVEVKSRPTTDDEWRAVQERYLELSDELTPGYLHPPFEILRDFGNDERERMRELIGPALVDRARG